MAKKRLLYRDSVWAFLFLLPNVVLFFAFIIIPIIAALLLSFMDWDILSPPVWTGLDNYIKLFTGDDVFWKIFWNTIYFTAVSVPLGIVLSMIVAIALNGDVAGKRAYRTSFFLPVISSSVIVSILWKWLYVPDFGLINYVLSWFGITGPNWLTDTFWAMPAIIIVNVWKGLGFNMLIFLAGLQSIPGTYYEAAEIDGGGWLQKTWYITIPMLSPTTFFVTIMSIIGSFQVFDTVMMMTNGGPARGTSVIVHYLYQNAFQYFKMGYACAISYVLFFLVLIVTLFQFKGSKEKDWSIY